MGAAPLTDQYRANHCAMSPSQSRSATRQKSIFVFIRLAQKVLHHLFSLAKTASTGFSHPKYTFTKSASKIQGVDAFATTVPCLTEYASHPIPPTVLSTVTLRRHMTRRVVITETTPLMDATLLANELPPAADGAVGGANDAVAMLSDPLALDQEQFNFTRSFGFMTSRRLQRRYRGVYKKYSFVSQVVTWVMVIYIMAVLATFSFDNSASNSQTYSTSDLVFYFFVAVVCIYIIVKIALVIQWLVYWVIVIEMLTYTITGNIHALFDLDDTVTGTDRQVRNVLVIVLICIEAITIIVYVFTHFTYPWLVKQQKLNITNWWSIKPGKETNSITYRSLARFYSKKRSEIKYCGGLNALGRPHGYGMWTDTSYHGERLTGQWEDGIPIGPFRSFEHGSGYSFANIRVGFCHNRAEKTPTDIFFWPKHTESEDLHWGVASVECSVSGGFFTFLPTVTHLTPSFVPESPQNAKDCISVLRTPTDGVVFTHDGNKPVPEPHETKPKKHLRHFFFHEKSAPVLDITESEDEKEALVLLHGYNCSLNYSMNRLAQLLSLGDFPSYIHPYVFSWPSGGVLAYFQAKAVGSESDRTSNDFRRFIQSLIDAGYSKLNIINHSMGARVFMSALNKGVLDDLLVPADPALARRTQGKIQLSTLTFCNPDYERNDFARYGGAYDHARQFCEHITLYADNMDGALFYVEILSKESVTGPLNYSLGKRGYMMHRDPAEAGVAGRADTEFRNWSAKNIAPQEAMDEAVALINQQGSYEGVTTFAFNRARSQPAVDEHAYGTTRADLAESAPLQYLDMDVIDTTWMDNNVHAVRHNYFNLNPTIVDDLRHLIVHKKRASSRPGLLKTTSAENVYIFLVAPSHVKNK